MLTFFPKYNLKREFLRQLSSYAFAVAILWNVFERRDSPSWSWAQFVLALVMLCSIDRVHSHWIAQCYQIGEAKLCIRYFGRQLSVPFTSVLGVSLEPISWFHRWFPTLIPFAYEGLRIRYHYGRVSGSSVLIVPEDPEKFLEALAQRAPHLVRDRNRLIAKPAA